MSDLRQNIVSGTQPTGHAQISAEGHFPFEISDEQLPESQPEGLGFSQSSEGLQNPLTTDLESRQSELSEYVSGNNQRPELAERQRPQVRGQEMHTASDGTVTDDPAGEDPEAITPPTSLSGINPGLDLLSHSQEQQGNAIPTRAATNMGRAKRLTALGTAVEGGRQPPGKHGVQVLQKGNEGRGSAAMQGHSQSSTEMVSLTTLGSLRDDEVNRQQHVDASEVHAAGLSATPVIHQTPIKGSAGHKTSVPTTPTSFPPQNADFPIAMELEDTSVSMTDDQAQWKEQ